MQYTVEDIRRQFDSGTFARGQAYAREGRVRKLAWTNQGCEGEVAGSGRSVYHQDVRVTRKGAHISIAGSCSCPMDYNCKHVVAVLVEALRRNLALPSPAAPGLSAAGSLSGATARWLNLLTLAQALHRDDAQARPARAVAGMAWVMVPDAQHGGVLLYPCTTRLLVDGTIAGAAVINSLHDLLARPPDYLRSADERAARLYIALQAGDRHGLAVKPAGELGFTLLQALCADQRLWWAPTRLLIKTGKLSAVSIAPARPAAFSWRLQAGSDALLPQLAFDDGTIALHVIDTAPALYLHEGRLGILTLPAGAAAIPLGRLMSIMQSAPPIAVHERTAVARHLVAQGLDAFVTPPEAVAQIARSDIRPTAVLQLGSAADEAGQRHDYARLSFDYDGVAASAALDAPLQRISANGLESIARDTGFEQAAQRALAKLGFIEVRLAPLDNVQTLAHQGDWIAFARDHLPRLRGQGWRIDLVAGYRFDLDDIDDWYADVSEENERSPWFDLELGIVVDGVKHPLLPLLLQLIRQAPRDFDPAALAGHADTDALLAQLGDGRRVALPWGRIKPILATLGELYFTDRIGNAIRLPTLDAARLAELEAHAQLRWLGGERLRDVGARLHSFDGIAAVAAPAGLHARLRDYQGAGLAWMQFLRAHGFGGILADDMGLGKTVQTLAHILTEKEAGRLDCPALVVAPTSLMDNWQSEAARFAPGLRVVLLHGKDRAAQFGQIAAADIVLTTYALLPRDEATLRGQQFHLLVLDESQYIKNSRAKAAQTACLIDARHRLCLTGTPLQNHLGELWSQFHFLMPGLLGDDKTFNATFRKPIEQAGDQGRAALLAKRVKPFMLRRTKDAVARELPPKTELRLPVAFGSAQRDLYETVRLAMDRKVRDEIARKGVARSQIVILDALLKLRQVCCDPRLLKTTGASAAAVKTAGSAKFDALFELLDVLLGEGRKILVFSQFTSMLALIGKALEERGRAYALLTGDTVERAAPVAAFQRGEVALFLISLKAGGVGLNLTAADTVIHFDPWWNPASEDQATDRAWRIGQDKPVFVYKLIVTGSVEEKIQELQRKKSRLAGALLGDGGALGEQITADDLKAIFS